VLLLAWILPGLLTIAGALTFAEMASAFPRAGGQYVFLREGMGRGWSFLYGWSMFWVIQTGIIAAVAIAFATFVDFFFDLPGQFTPLGPLTVPPWGVAVVAVACILLLSAVNYLGVKYGGVVQNVTTVAKVVGIAALAVGILLFGRPSHDVLGSALVGAPQGAALLSAFGLAVVSALFAYDGWPQATYVAAEVKDAKRNLPKALIIAPLITMAIYVSTVFAYIWALDIGAASAAGRPGGRIAADAALAVLGPTAAAAIVLVALISTFGTVNAYVLSSPRVFYALSKDGAFLASMGKLHPRRATPAFATVLMAEWASLLVLTGTYAQLVIVVVFSLWLFYIPTALAYFRLHKDPNVEKPFITPLYPIVPLVFLGAAVFIVLNTLLTAPVQALFSLVLIGAGVPVFAWQARRAGLPAGKREWVLAPVGERGT
jgi:APA family basic amino acid/polyamine antiporter